jgi:2-oxoisovalerate dehydrogenase E1 component
MPLERARRSLDRIRDVALGALRAGAPPLRIDPAEARSMLDSMLACRLTDIEAHALRSRGQGYYTICSAGHEGNVVLGRLTRLSDPALLHYRSGAFFLERARQDPSVDAIFDLLLSLAASADDPISGGRHKVFGSLPLGVPPQTSTIASHLPKAVGLAIAIDRAARLGVAPRWPADAIVICSFGDASLNHSTAQGALNAASWAAFQRLPVPVLFVCEDNTLGISVRTPDGWVEARMRGMPAIEYVKADGSDLSGAYEAARHAVTYCRERRAPVFLHLRTERLWGHAGSDLDAEYRAPVEIAACEARDPVALAAESLLEAGVLTGDELLRAIDAMQERVEALSAEAVRRPKLRTRDEVTASIAPAQDDLVMAEARRAGYAPPPEGAEKPKPLGLSIRAGLHDLMRKHPELIAFGEDVAQKGGVYGATFGLWKAFGAKRVFNTLLDEQTILGLAIGAGQAGLLPLPEIQFLAYLHNAEDQLRGEAATLSFFSKGQYQNPMVVRVAGLAYQKGFGGHFHNDDSLSVLRDLPGVVVGVPSRGDDAVRMLRTCLAAAKVDGRVCVLVEPIALYPVRDLEPGDGQWAFPFPPQGEAIAIGEVGLYGHDDRDLVILTYGNGVPMSLRVRARLAAEGVRARVVDLRWIAPLPVEAIRAHALEAGAVLVVDECRRSGNVSEAIATCLLEDPAAKALPFARVTSADSFVPLAEAANLVLAQEDEILAAARALVASHAPAAPASAPAPAARGKKGQRA